MATTPTTHGISDFKNKIKIHWPWPVSATRDVMLVFGAALLLRFIFISQLAATPDFSNPVGDPQDYLERAHEILQGDFLGSSIPFLSAPLYPVFMALCLGVSEFNFFFLRLVQIIIGALTCVLIYLMTRRIYPQEPAAALIAGLSAAAYAPLAYYDGDLLAIFMTTAAIALHGVALMAARYKPWPTALVSGLALGLAATDKLNLLLLLPLAGWYLFNGVTLSPPRPAGNFGPSAGALMLGTALVILPITINNYRLEKDFVIVSSNAGANLFIGNHEKAQGMFQLPPGMSLTNIDLHAQAEKETGRKLKPSQASAYWGGKAWEFLRSHPDKSLALYWKKFRLIWNGYEIPNHLDMYLIQQQYAPILKFLVIGFGLAAPLALLGVAIALARGPSAEEKLCLAYLVTITLSLLPFFITARYRLPMVPFLLALAGGAVMQLHACFRRGKWQRMLTFFSLGAILFMAVNAPPHIQISFSQNRVMLAGKRMENAFQNEKMNGAAKKEEMLLAVLELKRALEVEPQNEDANYNLARALEWLGNYSTTLKLLQNTLVINPKRRDVAELIPLIAKRQQQGDTLTWEELPRTDFERARDYERKSEWTSAVAAYEKVLRNDWHHLPAYAQLAALFLQQKQLATALKVYRRGLRVAPKNFYLMMNMAATYFMMGDYGQAKRIYEECLRQHPGDEFVAKQLATAANALELQRGRNRYGQSSLQPQKTNVAENKPEGFVTPESERK